MGQLFRALSSWYMFDVLKVTGEFDPRYFICFCKEWKYDHSGCRLRFCCSFFFCVLVALMGAKTLTVGAERLCWSCRRRSPIFCRFAVGVQHLFQNNWACSYESTRRSWCLLRRVLQGVSSSALNRTKLSIRS